MFLSTPADIAVYGGSAGGGKTWALLLEPLRHVGRNKDFGGVIFRRTYPQITNEGALWDESQKLYPLVGGVPKQTTLEWQFPLGSRVKFAHMQYEQNKLDWQGSQIPYVGFDELTHFTKGQFLYVGLSRGRSTCGVRPYVRATCNPDATSWVKEFLAPWLDKSFPNPAVSGELRWFTMDGGAMVWCQAGDPDAKSLTFIRASIWDNKILLAKDPGYLANLKALPLVERRRLLDGDWDIVTGGNMFRREWFEIVQEPPKHLRKVRFWDVAATEPKDGQDPDYTAGALVGLSSEGVYYVLDVQLVRTTPRGVERLILQTAELDGTAVPIWMEQEPGASGKAMIDHYARRVLQGFAFRGVPATGSKEVRANPLSSQAEAGNVKFIKGGWNGPVLDLISAFPTEGVHDDPVDAIAGAMAQLTVRRVARFY